MKWRRETESHVAQLWHAGIDRDPVLNRRQVIISVVGGIMVAGGLAACSEDDYNIDLSIDPPSPVCFGRDVTIRWSITPKGDYPAPRNLVLEYVPKRDEPAASGLSASDSYTIRNIQASVTFRLNLNDGTRLRQFPIEVVVNHTFRHEPVLDCRHPGTQFIVTQEADPLLVVSSVMVTRFDPRTTTLRVTHGALTNEFDTPNERFEPSGDPVYVEGDWGYTFLSGFVRPGGCERGPQTGGASATVEIATKCLD